jgi:putative membrane protein
MSDPPGSPIAPFVMEVEGGRAAGTPALAPRVMQTEQTGRVTPTEPDPPPPAAVEPAARSRGWRILFAGVGAFVVGWMLVSAVTWITGTYERNATLGLVAAFAVTAAAISLLWVTVRELRSFFALKSVEALQARFERTDLRLGPADAQEAIATVLAVIPQDKAMQASIEHFQRQVQAQHTPAQQLEILSRVVLVPLDHRAEAVVRKATARAFGITAISPTAITDALFFLACSVRMMREIAAAYGHRPTTTATLHLIRRLVFEAGRLGTIDLAATTLSHHLGGALAERLATTTAESFYAAQRMARLGLITMGMCRPIRFRPEEVPSLSSLVGNLLRRQPPSEPPAAL